MSCWETRHNVLFILKNRKSLLKYHVQKFNKNLTTQGPSQHWLNVNSAVTCAMLALLKLPLTLIQTFSGV